VLTETVVTATYHLKNILLVKNFFPTGRAWQFTHTNSFFPSELGGHSPGSLAGFATMVLPRHWGCTKVAKAVPTPVKWNKYEDHHLYSV
jgi:hypothetical protein